MKINGFLFGGFRNYLYLCISERNNIINNYSPIATRSSGILMKNTIIDELNNTGYVYRDNEDGTFDVCYDHDQDANFTGVNMYHVATVKEEGDLWCVNGNEGAGWGEYPKEDWTLERAIYDQCIDEHIN